MSIKRYDGANWIEPSNVKRFDGSNWIDADGVKRFDGSNWVTVYIRGTKYYFEFTGLFPSSITVNVSTDGVVTVFGVARSQLPSLYVTMDYEVPANTPFVFSVTCANILLLPQLYLGFGSGMKAVNVSKTLTTIPSTYGTGSLITPTVISKPYALFAVSSPISSGSRVGFSFKPNELRNTNTGILAPTPFAYNPDQNIIVEF